MCVGNPLRGDDAVAWHVAELLEAGPPIAARVLTCHQLVPEIAVDAAAASRVVVVDARDDGSPAGAVSVCPLAPSRGTATVPASHAFGPADLMSLAAELYGGHPDAVLVTVAVATTRPGTGLSHAVEAAAPAAADAVRDALAR